MKKITLVLLALAMSLGMNLSAQDNYGPNKDECIKYLSYYPRARTCFSTA